MQRHRTKSPAPCIAPPASPSKPSSRSARRHRFSLLNPRLALFTFLLLMSISGLFFNPFPWHRNRAPPKQQSGVPASGSNSAREAKRRLLTRDDVSFLLDGQPTRLISGSIHYFRFPPTRWRTVLQQARAMGLNTIETYVPWNLHEPYPGMFRFSGMLDLAAFLEICHEVGLHVLLRPGPYICSEWDLGGLPPFLLKDPNMQLRSSYRPYLDAVSRYFTTLAPLVEQYIGRPILGLQIENEFGAFGSDKEYMHFLVAEWHRLGINQDRLLFFTSDNGGISSLQNGSPFEPSEVLKTINFDRNAGVRLRMLRQLQPKAPAMVAEFWTGWFDHWGETHHTRSGEKVAEEAARIVNQFHASINLYMFFGGTNFGFMNGANINERFLYLPDTTSYDYDAMIAENGEVRHSKYMPLRAVFRKFWETVGDKEMLQSVNGEVPDSPIMSAYAGPVTLLEGISMYDVLGIIADTRVTAAGPLSMEEAGGSYGYIMYRHTLAKDWEKRAMGRSLQISGVRDFAFVLIDKKMVKTVDRNRQFERGTPGRLTLKRVEVPKGAKQIDIIIENSGRVNYGKRLHGRKGITGNVTLGGKLLDGFEMITMAFPQDHELLREVKGLTVIQNIQEAMKGRTTLPPLGDGSTPPAFFHGELSINPGSTEKFGDELPGTFCRVFGRGVLWINGFNLGRFHTGVSKPQRSLFVPGAILKEGVNHIMVLHMNMHLTREPAHVHFFEHSDYGPK